MMELVPLAPEDRDAFVTMVRAYLAEIGPGLPPVTADRIAQTLDDPAREALLIRDGGGTQGFALIRRLPDGAHEMSEFYIVPGARRSGLGTQAARAALTRHPGRWRLGVAKGSPQARAFWTGAIAPLARAHRGPPLTPQQSGSLHVTIKEPSP